MNAHAHHEGHEPHDHEHGNAPAAKSHVDPVCGMTVADDSPRRFEFEGTTYFFRQ